MAKQIYDYSMVKISNRLLDELTTEELFVWCALRYRYIMYTFECAITSIDLLSEEIKLYSHATKNRKAIKDILMFLQDKEHIRIEYNGELKNSTPLKIKLAHINPTSEYTALDNRYATITDHQALYVIVTLRRWRNVPDKTFSLAEWAGMLKVSVSTMQRIFERMEQQGLLYVESGEYYQTSKGEIRQYNNRYYLIDGQAKQEDEPVLTKTVTTESEQATVDKVTTVEPTAKVVASTDPLGLIGGKYTDKRLLERDNLIRNGAELTDYDFEIYLTTNDMELKKRAEYRFYQQIGKKEAGLKFVQDSLRRVERTLAEKETRNKRLDVMSTMPPPDKQLEYMIEDTAKEVDIQEEFRNIPWVYEKRDSQSDSEKLISQYK